MSAEAEIAQLTISIRQLEGRMDRLEKSMNDRNDELHAILRDIAVTTSHFDHTAQLVRQIEAEQDGAGREHSEIKNEIKNIKMGFSVVKWFIGLILPLILGIGLNQFFGGAS